MTRIKLALLAALVGASSAVMADDPQADANRQQRMDEALQSYRSTDHDASPGRFARTEESIKHGMHRAGHAIRHGAHKAGHAVGTGLNKTGEAIRHTGEKMEDATTTK